MKINILTIIPTSGSFEEFHFGKSFCDSLWIDFNISEDNHWIGCFSKSYENGPNKVLFDEIDKTCCVVAGGKGYLINVENKKVIFETEEHPLVESLVKSKEPNFYFLGNFYSIYVLDKNGLFKEIEPKIMVDGIYLEYQDRNKIIGKVDSPENQYERPLAISIDIETLEFDEINQKAQTNFFKKIFGK